MVKPQDWKWLGRAGHHMIGHKCAWHLCTVIGRYVVSTIGEYRPDGHDGEIRTIGGAGPGPDNLFFDTAVFEYPSRRDVGRKNGKPCVEVRSRYWTTPERAAAGHMTYCRRFSRRRDA